MSVGTNLACVRGGRARHLFCARWKQAASKHIRILSVPVSVGQRKKKPILEPGVQTMPRLLTAVKVLGCLAIYLHSTTACMALDPPGPPGGNPPPPLWLIQSPANGEAYDYDAHLACSGTAASNGTKWKLTVTAGTNTGKVTGSSANDAWGGTVAPTNSAYGKSWIGNASAVLEVNNNVEDQVNFSFQLP